MYSTLHELSQHYRRSKAGKGQAQGEYFLIDYEKFLRLARLADGDARELAEKELAIAESLSGGLLRIDRQARSNEPERIRLNIKNGEPWLFSQINEPSPHQQRAQQAQFFEETANQAKLPNIWKQSWCRYFKNLAEQTYQGKSILPFKRDDIPSNQELIHTLTGVLNWQGESLIRYASAVICGHSKRLGQLELQLQPLLKSITGEDQLESFGILHKPRSVSIHGPLSISIQGKTLDFSTLPGPLALSETNIHQCSELNTSAGLCLSVENEDVFHELAKRNLGNLDILLVLTSYPGSAVRLLYSMLPDTTSYYHFGDSDPSGFDILRDLREKTNRSIQPFLMQHQPSSPPHPLSAHDRKLLETLQENSTLRDVHQLLAEILDSNDKGRFEQEQVPIDLVLQSLLDIS